MSIGDKVITAYIITREEAIERGIEEPSDEKEQVEEAVE